VAECYNFFSGYLVEECGKMITSNYVVGAAFVTGQTAPVTGLYNFVGHVGEINRKDCLAASEECEIALSQGDTFPSHWSCGENVVWQLSHQSNRLYL